MDQTQDYAMQLFTGEEPMHTPIVKKMMGQDFGKFFRTEEENDQESYTEEDFAQDEVQANYQTDAKMGL